MHLKIFTTSIRAIYVTLLKLAIIIRHLLSYIIVFGPGSIVGPSGGWSADTILLGYHSVERSE